MDWVIFLIHRRPLRSGRRSTVARQARVHFSMARNNRQILVSILLDLARTRSVKAEKRLEAARLAAELGGYKPSARPEAEVHTDVIKLLGLSHDGQSKHDR